MTIKEISSVTVINASNLMINDLLDDTEFYLIEECFDLKDIKSDLDESDESDLHVIYSYQYGFLPFGSCVLKPKPSCNINQKSRLSQHVSFSGFNEFIDFLLLQLGEDYVILDDVQFNLIGKVFPLRFRKLFV